MRVRPPLHSASVTRPALCACNASEAVFRSLSGVDNCLAGRRQTPRVRRAPVSVHDTVTGGCSSNPSLEASDFHENGLARTSSSAYALRPPSFHLFGCLAACASLRLGLMHANCTRSHYCFDCQGYEMHGIHLACSHLSDIAAKSPEEQQQSRALGSERGNQ